MRGFVGMPGSRCLGLGKGAFGWRSDIPRLGRWDWWYGT